MTAPGDRLRFDIIRGVMAAEDEDQDIPVLAAADAAAARRVLAGEDITRHAQACNEIRELAEYWRWRGADHPTPDVATVAQRSAAMSILAILNRSGA